MDSPALVGLSICADSDDAADHAVGCGAGRPGASPGASAALAAAIFLALGCVAGVYTGAFAAEVVAIDDAGNPIRLAAPASRIISLAPHATELLFAAGAGDRIVGVSQYSNYPPQALQIASVGGAGTLDVERIATLKPDLLVAWSSGNTASQLARLRSLGIPVFESEPHDFERVASSLERLAALAGTAVTGNAAASRFRTSLAQLRAAHAGRAPVTAFFQVWKAPLITLNDAHLVSEALRLCGAKNIFGGLPQLAPTVSIEAVLQANPDVIITNGNEQTDALQDWRRFPAMKAVARHNLLNVPGDTLTRATPRVLDATRELCRQLDAARLRMK